MKQSEPRRYRVRYTEAIVRDAVRAYVWKRFVLEQKGLWFMVAAMLALFVSQIWNGNRSWTVGATGAAVFLPLLLVLVGWRAHFSNSVGKFRRMSTPDAEIVLHDDRLDIASEHGSGSFPWSSLTEVWERPGYWMIFVGRNQFNTLPITDLPPETRGWLRRKLPFSP